MTRSRIGSPGAQILAVLDDDRTFDLVVMGSHGRTGLRRALLGSVAEKVVRHAHCPVVVAHTRPGDPTVVTDSQPRAADVARTD